MVFGDLNDPQSEISLRLERYATRALREDLQLNTGVRYAGL
jgi:molybdopterin-containing oxidoreductase family iron-sulfur binding subunit